MKMNIGYVVIFLLVIVVGWSVVFKEPKTVDYYKNHQAEMEKVRKDCTNNPAKLNNNGDCINSQEAKSQLIWEQGKKNSSSIKGAINKGF